MIFCIHDVQGVHNAHVHVHDDFIVCGQDLYVVHFVVVRNAIMIEFFKYVSIY